MKTENSNRRGKKIYKVTIIGSTVNLALVAFKFVAGTLGNSAAMIADAVHSLSDFVTDIIVIVFVKISGKPSDKSHDYGHGKFETLATLIIGFILLLVGIMIAYNGSTKILAVIGGATLPSPGWIALIAALLSIALKEILYRYTVVEGRKLKSDALIANGWHHRSDAFSSIGTALGIGGALFLGAKWTVLDPIAALIVSVLIIITSLKLMKPAIDELLEKSLPTEVKQDITDTVLSFDGVSDLHNLRTRKVGTNFAIEFHVRMDPDTTIEKSHERITDMEKSLRDKFGPDTHIVIHIEPEKK